MRHFFSVFCRGGGWRLEGRPPGGRGGADAESLPPREKGGAWHSEKGAGGGLPRGGGRGWRSEDLCLGREGGGGAGARKGGENRKKQKKTESRSVRQNAQNRKNRKNLNMFFLAVSLKQKITEFPVFCFSSLALGKRTA